MRRRHFSLLLIGSLWLLLAGPAWSQDEVHEYTLDNGMKVLVKPDHRAPVVVHQVWYKVGSSYEHGGITGVSHVLEHMMFKGTHKHPGGSFSATIAKEGGRENAFTGRDYTAYYQVLAKDRLEVAMRMEADRMRNLVLPPEEFAKEVEVVKEERRLRTEDNPTSLTYEQFNAVAYLNSPYSDPVIGWMQDLDSLTVDDARAWYDKWYRPNNAVLVVVGDVEPEQVFALAKKYYGPIEAAPIPPLKPRAEVPQVGKRTVVVKAPAENPYLLIGYKAPVAITADEEWEPYALEVLAGVLDGGASARLSRELVRGQEVAASAGAGYSPFARLESLFMFDATPAQGEDVDSVKRALLEEIDRLKKEPVTPAELERVKAQVVADETYQRDSIQHQAIVLGMLEAVGVGWPTADEYAERIKAVTAEQVQSVARKFLIEDGMTLAQLDPQPIDPAKPPSHFEGHLR